MFIVLQSRLSIRSSWVAGKLPLPKIVRKKVSVEGVWQYEKPFEQFLWKPLRVSVPYQGLSDKSDIVKTDHDGYRAPFLIHRFNVTVMSWEAIGISHQTMKMKWIIHENQLLLSTVEDSMNVKAENAPVPDGVRG